MSDIEKKLEQLGLELPKVAAPFASYVPFVISGTHLFISGQLPFINGTPSHQGIVGKDTDISTAQKAAQNCALNILAQVGAAVDGDWSRVKRCVKLGAFIASTADFTEQPTIANGASELMVDILGDKGRHARSAVSVPSLPLNACVEIDAVFELAYL